MSTNVKNKTLYPHPFSKEYWKLAASEMKSTKMLVIAALMIALRVATKGLSVPIAPNLDLFNVAAFINALGAMIIGPVMAVPAAIVSDFLGVLIWDGLGAYWPPFVLQEIGSSLIWALLLYRAKVTPWRVMAGRFAICLIINIALGTPLLIWYQEIFMGKSSIVLTWPRIFKNLFMFPIESFFMTMFLSVMIPITRRAGLTYFQFDSGNKLKFSKTQIVTLALTFVLGVGCVCGYLVHYYQITSLTTVYTTQERIEKNKQMLTYIQENSDKYDEAKAITIVDEAKKEFLGDEITYVASVYTYEELDEETLNKCWALKKSGPKGDAYKDILTKADTAIIVVQEDSETVVNFSWKE